MPTFSKPVPPSAAVEKTQTRKRTLNPKLLSEDNVHADAIKRRKLEQAKSGNPTSSGTTESYGTDNGTQSRNATQPAQKIKATPKQIPKSHHEFDEDSTDEDVYASYDVGHPKNPMANLEAANGTDVIDLENDDPEIIVLDDEEEENVQEETDEQQLGIVKIHSWDCLINLLYRTTSKRLALTDLCFFQSHSRN